MGKVKVKVKVRLTNFGDIYAYNNKLIPENKVRTTEIEALVDTGALRC